VLATVTAETPSLHAGAHAGVVDVHRDLAEQHADAARGRRHGTGLREAALVTDRRNGDGMDTSPPMNRSCDVRGADEHC